MTANAFHKITQVETSPWEIADKLRANSNRTVTEYSMPVMGVIFLRHASNHYQPRPNVLDGSRSLPARRFCCTK